MPYVMDALFLGLFIFFAVRGYRRGLVRSLLGVGRLILAVLLTAALSAPVADVLEQRLFHSPIQDAVGEHAEAMVETAGHAVSGAIASLLATVTVFLAANLMLAMGLRLLSGVIHAIPLVAGMDRIGGLGLGVLSGAAAVWLVARVGSALLLAAGQSSWVYGSILLRMLAPNR